MIDSGAWTVDDRMYEADKELKAAQKARDEARRAYEWIPHEGDAFRSINGLEPLNW